MLRVALLLFYVFVVWAGVQATRADERTALVIGNSSYAHTRTLPNARNDASAISIFLRRIGYSVTELYDTSYDILRVAIRDYGRASAGADFTIVYFAGHGLEVAGENYVLPVDARLATSADLEYEAIKLNSIIDTLRGRRKLSLMIIDACRDNPLADKIVLREGARRSLKRGLARVEPKGDFLIAFAANAGAVAQDGTGINGPYAEALIRHLGKPGLDIRIALGGVRDSVMAATGNTQEPVIFGALGGQTISLVPADLSPDQSQWNNAPREREAREAWGAIKGSCAVGDISFFAARYTDTFFGDLATRRIREIEQRVVCDKPLDFDVLARSVQVELKRVGCFKGPINGSWRALSTAALKEYAKHANLADTSGRPSEEVLNLLKTASGRVCPLFCGSDERVIGDKCVKSLKMEAKASPVDGASPEAPRGNKSTNAVSVVPGNCASVRSACSQVRTQCLRACREKLEQATYGSCTGCVTSFATCMNSASAGACR